MPACSRCAWRACRLLRPGQAEQGVRSESLRAVVPPFADSRDALGRHSTCLGLHSRRMGGRMPKCEAGGPERVRSVEHPMSAGVRVGVFVQYMPEYRFGLWRALNGYPQVQITICAPGDCPADFKQPQFSDAGFRFRNTQLRRFRLPIMPRGKVITTHPYAVWSMLAGRFDVFVMTPNVFDVGTWMNLILARLLGRKTCLWGHGFSRRGDRGMAFFRRIMYTLAHAGIFYTDGTREPWVRRGIPPEKLFVAYNALDTDASAAARARATPEALAAFQARHGLRGKKVVIFVGRLVPHRRLDVLIQAMNEVVKTLPEAHAVIIGSGPAQPALEKLTADLGLGSHVTFPGLLYDEDELARYFLSSRVGVAPASAGLFIQHAFGYGVPVILGDDMISHGPEAELVVDGETGLYVRDGDVVGLARAVCRVLGDDNLHRSFSSRASMCIAGKYNVQSMARGFLKAILYCVEKGEESCRLKPRERQSDGIAGNPGG